MLQKGRRGCWRRSLGSPLERFYLSIADITRVCANEELKGNRYSTQKSRAK